MLKSKKSALSGYRPYLETLEKQELINFILESAQNIPRFKQMLSSRYDFSARNFAQITKSLREDIRALSTDGCDSAAAWTDSFRHICERLQQLLSSGRADDVVDLGSDFVKFAPLSYERGTRHDWEIACGLEECMNVILEALPASSLSHGRQLFWFIQGVLEDGYGVFTNLENITEQTRFKTHDWDEVRQQLEQYLRDLPVAASPGHDQKRKDTVGWLETARKKAEKAVR